MVGGINNGQEGPLSRPSQSRGCCYTTYHFEAKGEIRVLISFSFGPMAVAQSILPFWRTRTTQSWRGEVAMQRSIPDPAQ